MNETYTCARCGRVGTRQFHRASNPATGAVEWKCASWASCRERVWQQDQAIEKARTGE